MNNLTALEQNREFGISVPSAIKALWIAALRSGKYKQGKGRLKIGEGSEATYCCLGVLEEAVDGQVELMEASNNRYKAFPTSEWCAKHDIHVGAYGDGLPRSFFEPALQIKAAFTEGAATANDTSGMTFEQIADALERDLPAH